MDRESHQRPSPQPSRVAAKRGYRDSPDRLGQSQHDHAAQRRNEPTRSPHETALRDVLRMCQDTRIDGADAILQIVNIQAYVRKALGLKGELL